MRASTNPILPGSRNRRSSNGRTSRAAAPARTEVAMTGDILIERLRWTKGYAQRAYEEVMPAYDERGRLPDAHMHVFWSIEFAGGAVPQAWPDAKLIDDRFIRSFEEWAG